MWALWSLHSIGNLDRDWCWDQDKNNITQYKQSPPAWLQEAYHSRRRLSARGVPLCPVGERGYPLAAGLTRGTSACPPPPPQLQAWPGLNTPPPSGQDLVRQDQGVPFVVDRQTNWKNYPSVVRTIIVIFYIFMDRRESTTIYMPLEMWNNITGWTQCVWTGWVHRELPTLECRKK